MREDLAQALHGLSADELLETRRFIDRLLEQLSSHPGAQRPGPPPGASERRRFDRYSVNLSVTYFRHNARSQMGADAPVRDAVVRDISRGGLRFFATEALEPNELLTVYLPGALGVRRLFVEVRRIERRGNQYECGGSFVGLDRVVAAQEAREERGEIAQVLVACEPCTERDALVDLLVNQGYTVHVANAVPEAASMINVHPCSLVLAAAPLLLAEGGTLLKELGRRSENILSIALVKACDVDGPTGERLQTCHDFICEPHHPQEVRVVVGRTYRRLTALRARQAGSPAT
ncbi:MAG: PilZ domain-containing protein [Planctomycetota bacterium]